MMKKFLLLFILSFFAHSLISQGEVNDELTIDLDEIENDGKRIEVERYIGYEELLSRYLTLPYDISANTSNQGRFFDIGFVILAITPVALLFVSYRRKRLFYTLLLAFILYLSLSFQYSFVNVGNNQPVYFNSDSWDLSTITEDQSLLQVVLIKTYNGLDHIGNLLHQLISTFSGNKDHISYIVLFGLYLLLLSLLSSTKTKSKSIHIVTLIALGFGFLWIILSGGIIWYGFLLIPLILMIVLRIIQSHQSNLQNYKFVFNIIFACVTLWIFLAYTARISNIQSHTVPEEHLGKEVINSQLVYYAAGIHNANDSRNQLYRNIGSTFKEINENDGLIYQVGTSMTFEIANNPKRVFQDNTLIDFFKIVERYKNKRVIIDVLKASGFKYIIVDLFTHTLDKTPEQSLVKKFQLFLNTLYNNPKIKLLATDRVIQQTFEDGNIQFVNDVFGNSSRNVQIEVREYGSYAIYKII